MTKTITPHKEVKSICTGCEWNSVFEICCRMGQPCPHLNKPTCVMTTGVVWTTLRFTAKEVIGVKHD